MRFTSYLPGDLYAPAECIEQVESFAQKIQNKFNSEYGPDIHNERLEIIEFLYLVEKFLAEIFQKFFDNDTKVKAVEARAVKKKIQKILIHKILRKKTIFTLKPNEEEQETEQFDMDMVAAEEYITTN